MKRVTLSLDEKTVARARAEAIKRKLSLSRFVGDVLRKELRHADEYEAAYRGWRARKPFPLKGAPQPYPKRDELYCRFTLRRR